MSKLTNLNNNVTFELNLSKSKNNDFDLEFEIKLQSKTFDYVFEKNKMNYLDFEEVNSFITRSKAILGTDTLNCDFENFSFFTQNGYFEIEILNTYEEDLIEICIWINTIKLSLQTKEKYDYSYDEGVRFLIKHENFMDFIVGLETEIQ